MPQQENSRIKSFKNFGRDTDEMRRRRQETNVELRKQKKDDQLFKKRNVTIEDDNELTSPLQESNKMGVTFFSIEGTIQQLNSDVTHLQVQATQRIRKILSREKFPPINTVIEAGIVPRLVEFLHQHDNEVLQFEAAWALTNIASGTSEQTKAVVDAQGVPAFIALLSSLAPAVVEQAVWALGNIAGDGPLLRDYVINCGILKPLLQLTQINDQSLLRNVVWTISNLCRTKNPAPPPIVAEECLPVLAKLFDVTEDAEVLGDACWAFSYICDASDQGISAVIETGVLPKLVEALYSNKYNLVTPALRTVGNIVTGNDYQTQVAIDAEALPALAKLLLFEKINIQKEAAWALSNITAGNQYQIEAVIQANILPTLSELLYKGDAKVQKEVVWAVTNFTSGASFSQMGHLLNSGVLQAYCSLLTVKDAKLVQLILNGLDNMLEMAKNHNQLEQLCMMIEECGGLDLIEDLQKHENQKIYESSVKLIETYFGEEEEEDLSLVPTSNAQEFEFPMTTSNTFNL